MKKYMSFVGTGQLYSARYAHENRFYDTRVVQEAIASFFEPDEIILFVTDKAAEINLSVVSSAVSSRKVTVVSIPDGVSESDFWNIFSIIALQVEKDDEILIDITHAFRFLPLLAFLTALYIREVTGGTDIRILYGAYEAGEDVTDPDGNTRKLSPILDLTSCITLVDWLLAVRSFVSFADARGIRDRIRMAEGVHLSSEEGRDQIIPTDTPLLSLSGNLSRFTTAVQLARPLESTSSAFAVLRDLPRAKEEIMGRFPPLGQVFDRIHGLEEFAAPEHGTSCRDYLQKQKAIINYQVQNGFYLQAAEMAREWMVSAVICIAGDGSLLLSENVRNDAEDALRTLVLKKRRKKYKSDPYVRRLEKLEGWEELATIWSTITPIRNDLAHCGMNSDPIPVEMLEWKILAIPDHLQRFWTVLISKG